MTYHNLRKTLKVSLAIVSILLTAVEIKAIVKDQG
jgi:hypothetical protein